MKRLFISILLITSVFLGHAQKTTPQVITSSGAFQSNGGYSLSSSFGQPPGTITLSTGGSELTQGFQQPDPSGITCNLLLTNAALNSACFGVCNGSATATVSGGVAPYTYLWDNGEITSTASTLCSGMRSITITDFVGCIIIDSVMINELTEIVLTPTTSDASTCGASDGSITLAVSGGSPPYTYLWSNGATTQSISGIPAGGYSVSVFDSVGCASNANFNITQPSVLTLTSTTTVITCSGGDNGSIDLTVSGGTAPFTYAWSTGDAVEDLDSLTAGTYSVIVTEAGGCVGNDAVVVSELPALSLVTSVVQHVTICSGSDGIASAVVSGGTPPYNYVWSSGDTLATDSGMDAGLHYITVNDFNGCLVYGTVSINDLAGPTMSVASTDLNCNGDGNGAIDITVTGGTLPYTYLWTDGSTAEDLSGLIGGIYDVVVEDASGCIASASITVVEPDEFTFLTFTLEASCNTADGYAEVFASGGTTPYNYFWSSGGTSSSETGLAAGIYSVVVTDLNGCIGSTPIIVNNAGGPSITLVNQTNVNCGNPLGGALDVSVSGGTLPYAYSWTNGDTVEDISGLPDTTYNLTVTDISGCIAAATYDIIVEGPAVQPICIVTVDSATGKNLIVWEKTIGPVSYNIYKEGTASGVYFLLGNVPYDSLSVYLDLTADPLQRSWRYKIAAVDSCGTESELSLVHKTMHLAVNLGIGNEINLIWDPYEGFTYLTYIIYRTKFPNPPDSIDAIPGNLSSYTDLSPPSGQLAYQVSAIHPSGCTATKQKNFNSSKSNTSSFITGTSGLTATATAQDENTGNCNGSATVVASNGTSPYTYLWDVSASSQTTATAIALCAGVYSVTVTDANGDTVSTSATVGSIPGIYENDLLGGMRLYPNPSRGIFTLELVGFVLENVRVEIVNSLGQVVYSGAVVEAKTHINLSQYAKGVYNLKLISAQGMAVRKIVIE